MENEHTEELKPDDWRALEQPWGMKVFLTILYGGMLVMGIVGNGITIKVSQVLRRKGYLQKNVTDHMVSLACSDLLVLLIGLPAELHNAVWFPFASSSCNVSCKAYNFLFEACSYATILNVATLSFERYVAVCHPFRYKSLSGSRTVRLIIFAWIASALVALPLPFATGAEDPVDILEVENETLLAEDMRNLTFCTNLRGRWDMYRASVFVAFVVYAVVLASVGFMCRSMIRVLAGDGVRLGEPGGSGAVALPKHESSKVKASRKQTIVFLGLIVGALAGCWIPNQIRRLMTAASPKSEWTVPYFRAYIVLHPIADTFFYLSSVINPFLYNLSSRQFRRVFVQVLQCRLTIEHVNKRTLNTSDSTSARSLRPLLLRSFRRDRPTEAKATSPPAGHAPTHRESLAGPSESSERSATQESSLTSQTEI
ncbi:G-protein coupled receptor 39-like [Conger conger]|uniref:G-protein coupled receptor 39-like n=1 Tax=Conger conger TaxID=82655 RepID=UPI002A5B0C06|nr:G-protein coupled receptor 39-like [Conger conger]